MSDSYRSAWSLPGLLLGAWCALIASISPAPAADWPTYQHDSHRGGITSTTLAFPLAERWRYQSMHAPQPAWPPPAVRDIWNRVISHPRVTFDRAMQLVAGNGRIYFGSSVDGRVICLSAQSGETLWQHFTAAPIRLAPTLVNSKLYVGGDDGIVRCLDAANGQLLWQFDANPSDHWIPGNDRIISPFPVRTGVLVEDGVAYFGAGLFPTQGVHLFALNAADGQPLWQQQADVSPQGYLLASNDYLYVPTGRTAPAVFEKATGRFVHQLSGSGTTFALVSDDTLTYGFGRGSEGLQSVRGSQADSLAWIEGTQLIIRGNIAYSYHNQTLRAIDRARLIELTTIRKELNADRQALAQTIKQAQSDPEQAKHAENLKKQWQQLGIDLETNAQAMRDCLLWQTDCPHRYALILAGDALIAGGDDTVAAYHTRDGRELWSAAVRGNAYALAVAHEKLLVSTDQGAVHAFDAQSVGQDPSLITEKPQTDNAPATTQNPAAQTLATALISRSPLSTQPGYCLVLGEDDGRFSEHLARAAKMFIVVHQPDTRIADALRKRFHRAGLLGARISVHSGDDQTLPFTDYFANIITIAPHADTRAHLDTLAADGFRLLRPSGGQLIIIGGESLQNLTPTNPPSLTTATHSNNQFQIDKTTFTHDGQTLHEWRMTRAALDGAGEWSHPYANPGNTTSSRDTRLNGPLRLQWFGGPGPEPMLDRHHRNIPPLYKDGRLFVPGDQRVIAVDAYNGTTLWDVQTPGSRTIAAPLDAAGMVVGDDLLYIAVGSQCWALDVTTGERKHLFDTPADHDGQPLDWGYLAVVGDQLIGSAQQPAARRRTLGRDPVNNQYSDFAPVVASQAVFSINRSTGELQWQFDGGSILNPSLAIENNRLFLAQTPRTTEDGRAVIPQLKDDGLNLVALDLKTGQVRWRTCPDAIQVAQHDLFLSAAGGKLAAVMSHNKDNRLWYRIATFDAATGHEAWTADQENGATGGSHGEQVHHPTIIGDVLIAEPRAYNLTTGKPVDPAAALGLNTNLNTNLNPNESDTPWILNRAGHGCGTLSASASAIFYRASNPTMYQFGAGPSKITRVSRPGCWINIIPAGGLLLIPEASSGCSCSFSIQTSLAFIPQPPNQ